MKEDKEKFEEIKQHYKFITTGLEEKTKFIDISILEYLGKLIQITENLIARYKELEEISTHQSKSLLKYQNTIPKSKVKEKIEVLKKSMLKENESIEQFYKLKFCYEILQELLED